MTEQQFHQACGNSVDSLLIKAMRYQSLDNLSVVMIGLRGFKAAMKKAYEAKQSIGNIIVDHSRNQVQQSLVGAQHNSLSSRANLPPQSHNQTKQQVTLNILNEKHRGRERSANHSSGNLTGMQSGGSVNQMNPNNLRKSFLSQDIKKPLA